MDSVVHAARGGRHTRQGRQVKKTVRWYLMKPLEKVGEHDHEVDEVLWTDKDDALSRLRYDSDRRLLGGV